MKKLANWVMLSAFLLGGLTFSMDPEWPDSLEPVEEVVTNAAYDPEWPD